MEPLASQPDTSEVERVIRTFFFSLTERNLDEARRTVAHAYADWDHQIWSLWQDLEAIDMDPDDPAYGFEAGTWSRDLSWLRRIGLDDAFHWSERRDRVFVNVTFDGEVTDVSADFRVEHRPDGWVVVRESITMK